MRQLLIHATLVAGVFGFVMHGDQAVAQDHGGAGHGQVSLTDQIMGADANMDGTVTSAEIARLLRGTPAGHGGGNADGAGHHGVGGGGNPHGDLASAHGAGSLAALFGGHDGTALADMSQADIVTRLDMLVSHADTNGDAALNGSEVESLVAMMETMRAGGGH